MKIKPFKSFRCVENLAQEIASPPFDTVTLEEAKKIVSKNRYSFLRISRPEVNFDKEIDPFSEESYAASLRIFREYIDKGLIFYDDIPSYYIYRMKTSSHTQTGIIGCCHVSDLEKNIIKKHEAVRSIHVQDRMRLILNLKCHLSPVYLCYYASSPCLQEELERAIALPPNYRIIDEDNVIHKVWKIASNKKIERLLLQIPCAYIVDGHHRAAASLLAAKSTGNEIDTKNSENYWFMIILFPHNQLQVFAYHRIIKTIDPFKPEDILLKLKQLKIKYSLLESFDTDTYYPVKMILRERCYGLEWPEEGPTGNIVEKLDVSKLHSLILEPIFNIDAKTDPRLLFIAGANSVEKCITMLKEGKAEVVFLMNPIKIETVIKIADAGLVMPPKSTWFAPKPRSGLILHPF